MDIKEISDRMDIEKLVTDYATAVDSRDFNKFHMFFTEEAFVDYTATGGISGSIFEIVAFLESAMVHFPNYQHFISNISLNIAGDTATGKVMCLNPMQTKDNDVFFLGMWYQDTYKKIQNQWRISSRIQQRSWSHNVPLAMLSSFES